MHGRSRTTIYPRIPTGGRGDGGATQECLRNGQTFARLVPSPHRKQRNRWHLLKKNTTPSAPPSTTLHHPRTKPSNQLTVESANGRTNHPYRNGEPATWQISEQSKQQRAVKPAKIGKAANRQSSESANRQNQRTAESVHLRTGILSNRRTSKTGDFVELANQRTFEPLTAEPSTRKTGKT